MPGHAHVAQALGTEILFSPLQFPWGLPALSSLPADTASPQNRRPAQPSEPLAGLSCFGSPFAGGVLGAGSSHVASRPRHITCHRNAELAGRSGPLLLGRFAQSAATTCFCARCSSPGQLRAVSWRPYKLRARLCDWSRCSSSQGNSSAQRIHTLYIPWGPGICPSGSFHPNPTYLRKTHITPRGERLGIGCVPRGGAFMTLALQSFPKARHPPSLIHLSKTCFGMYPIVEALLDVTQEFGNTRCTMCPGLST